MNSKRIAILGSGPTGLAAALVATSLDFEVDLVDPWRDYSVQQARKTVETQNSASAIAKKSFRGSLEMYKYPSNLIDFSPADSYPISSTKGGLSSVWGANAISWRAASDFLGRDKLHPQVIELLSQHIELIESNFGKNNLISDFFLKVLDFKKLSRIDIQPSLLAVYNSKCIKCGECLIGCKYGAIFDAAIAWQSLINQKKINLVQGMVENISTDESKVQLTYSRDGLKSFTKYDKVFVACGSIATSALLMRSQLIPARVNLSDTQVFYLGFLKLKAKVKIETKFTLSQIFVRMKFLGDFIHLSLYETSEESISRGKSALRFIPNSISGRILSRVVPGIGFAPVNKSSKIFLELFPDDGNVVKISYRKGLLTKLYIHLCIWRNLAQFLRSGLLPFPFMIKIPNPGASYHVGALMNEDKLLPVDGKLPDIPNVFLIDSSALRTLPSGPITIAAMLNAGTIALRNLVSAHHA